MLAGQDENIVKVKQALDYAYLRDWRKLAEVLQLHNSEISVNDKLNRLQLTLRFIYNKKETLNFAEVDNLLFILQKIIAQFALMLKTSKQTSYNPHNIAELIYYAGNLVERYSTQCSELVISISASDVSQCISLLPKQEGTSSLHIVHTFSGLALLAKHLTNPIKTESINQLFERLLGTDRLNAIDLKNSITYLRDIVKHKKLDGTVTLTSLDRRIDSFSNNNHIHPSIICYLLYSIGWLAFHGKVASSISVKGVNRLLSTLSSRDDIYTISISNAFYGLGRLAEKNMLTGTVDVTAINAILVKLSTIEIRATQSISNPLYSIGLLSVRKSLDGMISSDPINAILLRLNKETEAKPFEISQALYGIGLLAANEKLSGEITTNSIQLLIVKLCGLKKHGLDSQAAANSLYAIGLLASENKLSAPLSAQHINALLSVVCQLDRGSPQHISNAIYGVSNLLTYSLVSGTIGNKILEELLKRFATQTDAHTQHISNVLYGAGNILKDAEKGNDFIRKNKQIIIKLLYVLINKPDLDILHVASVLYSTVVFLKLDIPPQLFQRFNQFILENSAQAGLYANCRLAKVYVLLGKTMPRHVQSQLIRTKPAISERQNAIISKLKQGLVASKINNLQAEKMIGAWFVDLYMEYSDQKIIIELDSESIHYANDALRSQDQRRDAWLQSQGYNIIRIKVTENTPTDSIVEEIHARLAKLSKQSQPPQDKIAGEADWTVARSRRQRRRQ